MINIQQTELETHCGLATAQVDLSVMKENIAIVVGLHMTLECRDTELWPFFRCASQCLLYTLR